MLGRTVLILMAIMCGAAGGCDHQRQPLTRRELLLEEKAEQLQLLEAISARQGRWASLVGESVDQHSRLFQLVELTREGDNGERRFGFIWREHASEDPDTPETVLIVVDSEGRIIHAELLSVES